MAYVKPKKHLGQHFLIDQSIAWDIVDALSFHQNSDALLEIGPGTGVLTEKLMQKHLDKLSVVEIDAESVQYLKKEVGLAENRIIFGDFLQFSNDDFNALGDKVAIIGNFPYNISSQIFFKILDHKDSIPEVVCMLQKEVAERIASKPGKKSNGILSIFIQVYYDVEYLFTVSKDVFNPPPKVLSGVISLKRNHRASLEVNESLFKSVVKQAFNQRRKTMRNALKPILPQGFESPYLDKRAEQLGVDDFIILTRSLSNK